MFSPAYVMPAPIFVTQQYKMWDKGGGIGAGYRGPCETVYPFFMPAFSISFICCSDIGGILGWASLA